MSADFGMFAYLVFIIFGWNRSALIGGLLLQLIQSNLNVSIDNQQIQLLLHGSANIIIIICVTNKCHFMLFTCKTSLAITFESSSDECLASSTMFTRIITALINFCLTSKSTIAFKINYFNQILTKLIINLCFLPWSPLLLTKGSKQKSVQNSGLLSMLCEF